MERILTGYILEGRRRQRKVVVYKDKDGGFRFRCRSGNGTVVGASEESRTHLQDAVDAAHQQFPDAEIRVRYVGVRDDVTDYVVGFE